MSGEGSVPEEWANLTPDCLFTIFSKLTVEEMLEGPLRVCKPWSDTGNKSVFSVFDVGSRTVEPFDWTDMEEKMDALLKVFADKSDGGLKSIKIKLCTDQSISYVAEKCPVLEVLWLTTCPTVTDDSMLKIATKCNKLKHLRIRQAPGITEKTLEMVKKNCRDVVIDLQD
ncbi:hypothetical protein IGI04_013485 [Brassica rapa subsp. trilocularis]|uniref:F-box domain-containing protein n=1 Tax=Brassica rapa subsp. trilocularis TaxID=1813537 RepID=A0ABQ7NAX9_BRACM|nr:hypothetical protein IGI04_013485 [Brassica rapa subsp. trilocularis]